MKNQLKLFKQSFQFKKKFLHIFLIDAGFWVITALFYFSLVRFLYYKYNTFAQGQTVEQIKELMATANPEQLSALLTETKVYFFTLISSIVLFILFIFLAFALSQALIWYLITHQKLTKRKYFKWVLLMFFISFVFILTLIPFVFIKFFTLNPLVNNPVVFNVVGQILNLLYSVTFIFVFFLICYYFTHHQKIFQSLADVFHVLKQKFKSISTAYLFSLLLAVVLSSILFAVLGLVSSFRPYILYLNYPISLLFLAWLRLYLVKIVH